MTYLLLIYEFFKIGLFSFGGGYATIPFLYQIAQIYDWYTIEELSEMFAVAAITPGPVGINVATYAGFKAAGISGALCATIFEMFPSLILVIIVSSLLSKFKDNFYVKAIISSLKPISCALLLFVALEMLIPVLGNLKLLTLLAVLLIISWKSKKDPIVYILISAIAGIIFFAV